MHHAFDGELELEGPLDGGWYHTRISDWIALNAEVNHAEFRLYCIMRSLILEKRAAIRRLTVTELAGLMPGVNGKPTGRSTVENVLKRLRQHGLVERLDAANSGGPARWRIHDWPQSPEDYTGWRNTFDKLDALRNVDNSTEGETHSPQKQGGSGAPPSKSKGGPQKSKGGPQKSGPSTRGAQAKRHPQEPLPQDFPQPGGGATTTPIHTPTPRDRPHPRRCRGRLPRRTGRGCAHVPRPV